MEAKDHHRRTLTRFFDSWAIFQVQRRLHVHKSWRTTTRPSLVEPTKLAQVTKLLITSWNPESIHHGKLERFLNNFDADKNIAWHKTENAHDTKKTGKSRTAQSQGEKLAKTQRSDSFGRIRTTGKRTFGAQRPRKGPRHKDGGQAFKTHTNRIRTRLPWQRHSRRRGDWRAAPLRDAHGHWSAYLRNLRSREALKPSHGSAKPVPAKPSWEGNTWQGHNGVQTSPDHILHSVDLSSTPGTIDVRSS